MSDKELVALIRSAPWSDGFPYLKETADRIEELEAKLAKAVDELDRLGFDCECIVGRQTKGESHE